LYPRRPACGLRPPPCPRGIPVIPARQPPRKTPLRAAATRALPGRRPPSQRAEPADLGGTIELAPTEISPRQIGNCVEALASSCRDAPPSWWPRRGARRSELKRPCTGTTAIALRSVRLQILGILCRYA